MVDNLGTAGARVNFQRALDGSSVLAIASHEGHVAVVQVLLSHGAPTLASSAPEATRP